MCVCDCRKGIGEGMNQKAMALGPMIVDLTGLTLTAEDRRRLAHPMTAGVILFGRNFKSRLQVTKLIRSIRAIRPNIIISVDHEGGRVQRFKTDGFTHLPSMRTLGELYAKSPMYALKVASQVGYVLATELRAVGVDFSYTPVLDLDYGGSTVIGDRAFSASRDTVVSLAKSVLHGMLRAGMVGCGKHFPGHGYVVADSHTAMPIDQRGLKRILADDVVPYAALSQDLGVVIPAHVIYPKVEKSPAGFSKTWLGILREQLQFHGAIVTDDLSMAGAALIYPDPAQRVRAALDAGCDMAMVCNRPADLDVALNGLPQSYLRRAQSAASVRRINGLRARGEALAWRELQKDAAYQSARQTIAPYIRNADGQAVADPTEIMLKKR